MSNITQKYNEFISQCKNILSQLQHLSSISSEIKSMEQRQGYIAEEDDEIIDTLAEVSDELDRIVTKILQEQGMA